MLKKYENFKKISTTEICSFYQANQRQNMQKVLMKRIRHKITWNDLLKSKSLKIQNTQQFIPQINEILKSNGEYFIVYQKPTGSCLSFFQQHIKKQISQFYEIMDDFLDSLKKLKQYKDSFYIYPEWLFFHRNKIKICHFEQYLQDQILKKKSPKGNHVFLYDITSRYSQNQKSQDKANGLIRIKNINFNLGYISYHLLTGKSTFWKPQRQDYESKIKQIQLNASARMSKELRDFNLVQLIDKLLKCEDISLNVQEDKLLFQQFKNYVKIKNKQINCCKNKEKLRSVEFSLQKLKLQKKTSKIKEEKKKKCYRPCCQKLFQQDLQNPQNSNNSNPRRYQIVEKVENAKQRINKFKQINQRKNVTQNSSSQSHKKIFNTSNFGNKYVVNRHKRNSSCLLPTLMQNQRKSSLNFNKARHSQSQFTVFKKNQEVQTPKSYLKTQI